MSVGTQTAVLPEFAGTAANRPITVLAKRTSWAAIFAGVIVALVAELLLSLVGLGIGASTIDPLQDASPMSGIGIGAGLWFIGSSLLALFLGGWTAGRLAGLPYSVDSILHGVITWGLTTLLTFYLLGTAAGSLLGGAAQILTQGAGLIGRGAMAAAPAVSDAIKGELKSNGVDLSDIRKQANLLLVQTGKKELRPDSIERQTKQVTRDVRRTGGDAAANPQSADTDLNALLNRIFEKGSTTLAAADREALVNVIVARTDMGRAEANKTVDQWQATYQNAYAKYEQAKTETRQKALEVADATARNVSRAALWTSAALLLGLAAAGYGGLIGTSGRKTLFAAQSTQNN